MVKRVGSIATIESLNQVHYAVVIVIKIIEIVDSVVVVILGLGLFKVKTVPRVEGECCGVRNPAVYGCGVMVHWVSERCLTVVKGSGRLRLVLTCDRA